MKKYLSNCVSKLALTAATILLMANMSAAKIVLNPVEYQQGGFALAGFIAYDDSQSGPRPGVLIIHQWMGITDYEKMRAEQLAKTGYVAFVADIYGKGVRPKNSDEAGAQAGMYRKDRQLLRDRGEAALAQLQSSALVDKSKIAAIGYCFGGGAALELARSGASLAGVVSFHGNLDTPNPADAQNIKSKILVLHGGIDPYVKPEVVSAFEKEMTDASVDWQLISYGGAVHSFTIPTAGNDISTGSAYNEKADKRSWEAMKQFFGEIFK